VAVLDVILRPRVALANLAGAPRIGAGLAAVLLSGIASLLVELAANSIVGGANSGLAVALVLPVLFLAYWVAAALVIDAGAGLFATAGRWRAYLAVSGFTFVPWIGYALLSLLESWALRGGGDPGLASLLAWLTLPLLAWYLVLTALAIRAVYDVTPFVAAALAMLPDAVLVVLLIAALLVTGVLRAAGLD
jgi:Yip1 domain